MKEYNPQHVRDLFTYVERLNAKRGELLNETINLEAVIDVLIASHFCNDQNNQNELLSMIIRKRLNFAAKITIISTLINTHYKPLLNTYPQIVKHLTAIKDLRNKLSHMILHTPLGTAGENLKNRTVEFLDENLKIRTINEDEIQGAINLAKLYVLYLRLGIGKADTAPPPDTH